MFKEWRPGDWGWTWRANHVWDSQRRRFLFDPKLNTAVLLICGSGDLNCFTVDHVTHNDAYITLVGGRTWHVHRSENTLFVALPNGETRTFTLPMQCVERVAAQLPHPEGGTEVDIARVLIDQCDGGDLEELDQLLSSP